MRVVRGGGKAAAPSHAHFLQTAPSLLPSGRCPEVGKGRRREKARADESGTGGSWCSLQPASARTLTLPVTDVASGELCVVERTDE